MELSRQVILYVILAQLLAAADHEGPPHGPRHPRRARKLHGRRPVKGSVTGRRPRG